MSHLLSPTCQELSQTLNSCGSYLFCRWRHKTAAQRAVKCHKAWEWQMGPEPTFPWLQNQHPSHSMWKPLCLLIKQDKLILFLEYRSLQLFKVLWILFWFSGILTLPRICMSSTCLISISSNPSPRLSIKILNGTVPERFWRVTHSLVEIFKPLVYSPRHHFIIICCPLTMSVLGCVRSSLRL